MTVPRDDDRIVDFDEDTDPVLQTVTSDERDLGWGELPSDPDDNRYLDERPPHYE